VSISNSKELNNLLDEMFADTSGTVMPKTTYVQQFIDAVTPALQADGSKIRVNLIRYILIQMESTK
jgi:hypothetical protein